MSRYVTNEYKGVQAMKKFVFFAMLALSGCGYSSVDNELIGQPKKMLRQTPIVCPDRVDVDVSLGVMQGGSGSMSTQDHWLVVPNAADRATLETAIAQSKAVKIHYDSRRVTFCEPFEVVKKVEVL